MIVFTLYMVRFFFIMPTYEYPKLHLQVANEVAYALFALSFVFMAAGGYIINDYYDVEIDKINKPDRVLIENAISSRSALTTYWLLNILGLASGFISCYWAGIPFLATLFLFYFVGLWFYSYKLKSTFLLGNILIGICLALVPLGGACINLCSTTIITGLNNGEKKLVWEMMLGIAAFAFLSTLIREIIKDAEDIEGDKTAGCHTIPIVMGIGKTKWGVSLLILLLNIVLGYIEYQFKELGFYSIAYFLLFIQVPFIVILYKLLKASTAKHFHRISIWLKILMLTGIVYVFALANMVYSISLFFSSFSNSFK